MDEDLPGYAWDLLPFEKKTLICIGHRRGMLIIMRAKGLLMHLFRPLSAVSLDVIFIRSI